MTTTTSPFDRSLNLVGKRFRRTDKVDGTEMIGEIVYERVGLVDYRILSGYRAGTITSVDRKALEKGEDRYFQFAPLAEDGVGAVPSVA